MTEYRKKCNTCGRIFCYTDDDVKKNRSAQLWSGISDLASAAGAFSGNWGGAIGNQNNAIRNENKVVDYNRCPYCNSTDVKLLTPEEWEKEQKARKKINSGGVAINANASEESLTVRVENFIEDADWSSADAYSNQILDVNPKNGYIYYLRILIENEVKSPQELINNSIDITESRNYKYARKYGNEKIQTVLDKIISSVRNNEKKDKDQKELLQLRSELDSAVTPSKIDALIDRAKNYQENNQIDLFDFINEARNKKEQIDNNNRKRAFDISTELEKAISSGTKEEIEQKKSQLLKLKNYGDFDLLLEKADEKINDYTIKEQKVKKKGIIIASVIAIVLIVAFVSIRKIRLSTKTGIYSGTAEGMRGPITVTLTYEKGKIVKCEAIGENETNGVGSRALEKLPKLIVKENSADVDDVSGATETSEGIKEAAKKAMKSLNRVQTNSSTGLHKKGDTVSTDIFSAKLDLLGGNSTYYGARFTYSYKGSTPLSTEEIKDKFLNSEILVNGQKITTSCDVTSTFDQGEIYEDINRFQNTYQPDSDKTYSAWVDMGTNVNLYNTTDPVILKIELPTSSGKTKSFEFDASELTSLKVK